MKAKLVFLHALMCITMFPALQACSFDNAVKGSGNIITETRNVKDFKGIENHGSVDVIMRQGSTWEVKIETDDNIAPIITTEVENERLVISSEKNFRTKKVTAYITIPELDYISVNGSGDYHAENTIKGTDLEIFIKGSGNVGLTFEGRDVQTSIKGSGDIKLNGTFMNLTGKIQGSGNIGASGKASVIDVVVQGSGDFNASDLECKEAKVTIQGSGSCNLNVSSKLSGKIQGSGDIRYRGEANIINLDRQGSGSIVKE